MVLYMAGGKITDTYGLKRSQGVPMAVVLYDDLYRT